MSEKVKRFLTHKWMVELYRLLPFLGLAGFVILPDDGSHVVIFGTAIVMLAIGVGHLARKILFPYFDIKELVSGIEDDPKASAAVICGMIYLVCTIINAFVTLLK